MGKLNVVTPNTNISAGSVSTGFIKDAAVTLAKISTSGASDNQILVYDHATTSIVWETPSLHYTDAEAITAVQGEATLDLTGKTSISNSAGLTSPILHLVTDNSGWDKAQLMLTDANDDAVSIIGRNNTTYSNYQLNYTLDPNHTKPRTNVSENNPVVTAGSFVVDDKYTIKTAGNTDFTAIGSANNNVGTVFTSTGAGTGTGTAYKGDGNTYAGDYFVNFRKNYGDQDNIDMQMEVYGANNGFSIVARDDWNGGVDSYNYKPITLRGSDIAMKIGSTPYGSTVEKLAFNDYGTSISNGVLVHGLDRSTSNHQIQYTGTCTAGTPAIPSMVWIMHRRDSQNRIMEIMEATDYGSGDAAVVEIGKQLTINPVKVASAVPIELANLPSAPGSPTAGMMYFNTSDSKFYGYNGSAWILLDTQ